MLQHIKNWWLDNSLFVAISLSLGVIFLSLLNMSVIPSTGVKVSDKALHSIAYMVLMWSWLMYFRDNNSLKNRFLLIISLTVFGIILEVLQGGSLVNRTSDWKDVIANVLGLLLGMLTFGFLYRIIKNKDN